MAVATAGRAWLGCGALAALACGQEPLPKPEVFRIIEEPVSFSPPPAAWRREPHTGLQHLVGISFKLGDGLLAEIDVGEYDAPGLVRSRECLRAFLPKYREMSYYEAQEKMQRCRPGRHPLNDQEAVLIERFRERFSDAFGAHTRQDAARAEASLRDALAVADQATYSIDDVLVVPYRFSPTQYEDPSVFLDLKEERVEVGGRQALAMSYRIEGRQSGRTYHGRWVYALSPNHHLFAFRYYGHAGSLGVFERVIASVTFPPAQPR